MSHRSARITADDAIRIVKENGFLLVRQSGSHKIFRNAKGMRVTIPYHKGKILHPKLFKAIYRDVGIL